MGDNRKKDGLMEMLEALRRGIEYTGWSGGAEYQKYLFSIVDGLIDIHENGTVVPKIDALLAPEINKVIEENFGFHPLTQAEWPIFAEKLFKYVDWHSAVHRTFWEEILPLRVGRAANINQHYKHTYVHCDGEWETRGYVSDSHKCPMCNELLSPTCSVPIPNE